jgi:hypothetical protein
MMKRNIILLVSLIFIVVLVVGCQSEEAAQPVDTAADSAEDPFERFRTGELGQMNTLAMGTLLLEGTDSAVTQVQAADLLPLWEVIQSGSLKSQAETDAVLKQIEGIMTSIQLDTIEGMELTRESMATWMEKQGVEVPSFGGEGAGGGRGAGFGQMGDMTEEERAQIREQLQALRDLSPEERQERMAEMGFEMPEGAGEGMQGGGFGGGARGGNFLLTPLIDLLTDRAAG